MHYIFGIFEAYWSTLDIFVAGTWNFIKKCLSLLWVIITLENSTTARKLRHGHPIMELTISVDRAWSGLPKSAALFWLGGLHCSLNFTKWASERFDLAVSLKEFGSSKATFFKFALREFALTAASQICHTTYVMQTPSTALASLNWFKNYSSLWC